MITAEEFYKEYCNKRITTGALNGHERLEVMIEFAKLHVEEAIWAIVKAADNEIEKDFIKEALIRNAYSLENIK
jgi:hypothetical protein